MLTGVPEQPTKKRSIILAPIRKSGLRACIASTARFLLPQEKISAQSNKKLATNPSGRMSFGRFSTMAGAVVVTVSVTVVGVLVAFTDGGTNVQVVLAGRGPQLKVTGVGNVPCALTLREYVAEPPRVTVTVALLALRRICGCTEVTPVTVNGYAAIAPTLICWRAIIEESCPSPA